MKQVIMNAVESAWEDGAKVHVLFEVSDTTGRFYEDMVFPDKNLIKLADGRYVCTINVSVTACKYFVYNDEFNDFTYDIAVNGKPFFGNIIPERIIMIYDAIGLKVYYNRDENVTERIYERR